MSEKCRYMVGVQQRAARVPSACPEHPQPGPGSFPAQNAEPRVTSHLKMLLHWGTACWAVAGDWLGVSGLQLWVDDVRAHAALAWCGLVQAPPTGLGF